jgi:hypothetical protein
MHSRVLKSAGRIPGHAAAKARTRAQYPERDEEQGWEEFRVRARAAATGAAARTLVDFRSAQDTS